METVITEEEIDINPNEEGVTHINIYSKAKSELGRLLSNFAHTPIEHPRYGRFESIEGFWYWLSTGMIHNNLKTLYGLEAKKVGKTYPYVEFVGEDRNFDETIEHALKLKVLQNRRVFDLMKVNVLPYYHYYYFGDLSNCKVIKTSTGTWLAEAYARVQEYLSKSGWSHIF